MERQSLAIMQVLDTKHSDFHTDKAIDTSAEGDLTQHLRSHRALWAGYHAGNPGQHMAQKTSEKRDFDRIEQMGGGFAEGNLGVGSNFQDGLAHFVMGGMKAKRSSGSTKPGIGAARTKVYFLIVGVFVLPALM